jgi:hypothetical protein
MIRSGVERMTRTASRRIVLRALVVGGFAGAAWLLSASAAQAADAPPAPDRGAAPAHSATVLTPLTDVLDTATAPVLDATSALVGGAPAPADPATAVAPPGATADRTATIVGTAPAARPDRPADRAADPIGPVTTLLGPRAAQGTTDAGGAANRSGAGQQAGGPTGTLLNQLVAPLGLTSGSTGLLAPVTRVVDPVLAPLTGVLRPVGAILRVVAAPLDATLGTVTRTVTGVLPAPPGGSISAVTPGATSAVIADPTRTGGTPRASHTEDGSAVKNARHGAGKTERETARPSVRPNPGDQPGRPYPAPLRGYLGAGTGTPASGSGSPTEGGAFSTVASTVAGSMVAFHQLPEATDVTVLRLDAEDPTFSPD